ncbi:MAG: GGDEF domain-containing protein [Clostridiales bacterium]|jgi:diguanylate cyclase (GGDEF)-like protein|nr:GGDEF domain-containing protein [Clostridiales bacterium]
MRLILYVSTAVSCALCVTSALKWESLRQKYFFPAALSVFLMCAGNFIEISSDFFDSSLLGLRAAFIGFSLTGPFCYVFWKDYKDGSARPAAYAALFLLPAAACVSAALYPVSTLVFKEGARLTHDSSFGWGYHIQAEYGWAGSLAAIYNFALLIITALDVSVSPQVGARSAREHFLAFVLPAFLLVSISAFASADYLSSSSSACLLSSSFSAMLALFYWNTKFWRNRDWRQEGRGFVLENSRDGYIMMDEDGCFLDANKKALEYFPALKNLEVGARLYGLPGLPLSILSLDKNLVTAVESGGVTRRLRASRCDFEHMGRRAGTSVFIFDDTENYDLMEKMRLLSQMDALTGLYNRRAFFELVQRDFGLHYRNNQDAAILMLDLDHFKRVNDTYGHNMGDIVLINAAKEIKNSTRRTDVCARYGGEELIIWLPATDLPGAVLVAENLRNILASIEFHSTYDTFHVTMSTGVASITYGEPKMSLQQLIANADSALYAAKTGGRNQVRVYRGAQEEGFERPDAPQNAKQK